MKSKPNRGVIVFVDGQIQVQGPPPYDPPASITADFIRKLFSYPQGHEFFLPTIASDFSSNMRSRLLKACRNIGGDIWAAYKLNAIRWASLTSDDCAWHTDRFFMVYEAEVEAPLISFLSITDRNIRLVHTPVGWLTFAEFSWRYDQTVQEHLELYLQDKAREHDALCQKIKEIIEHAAADLTIAPLTVAGHDGVGTKEFVGLTTIQHKSWRLPDGLTFLDDPDQP